MKGFEPESQQDASEQYSELKCMSSIAYHSFAMNISDKEFASMFAKTLESTRVLRQTARIPEETGEEGDTSYVFILNRKLGGIRAHFLSLHPYKGYILPHIQHVTWPKLKGW